MMFEGAGHIYQNAYVVDDLDRAIDTWINTIGAGPFFVLRRLSTLAIEYHDEPSTMDISIAVGQAGPIHIELIQVHSKGPTVYTDMHPIGSGGGFHHLGMLAVDFPAAIDGYRAAGHRVGMTGVFGSTPFAYIDTRASIGFFTEFHADTAEIRGMFKMIADASRDWDGTDPKRPLV
jgi:hypothetical protein